ncbi:hypothetical protein AMTRI_Chr06g177560 [Amborella trichopoda]
MVSEHAKMASAPIPVNNSDKTIHPKKKKVHRSAKLKKCKLDARREQWLTQGKDNAPNEGGNGRSWSNASEKILKIPRPSSKTKQLGSNRSSNTSVSVTVINCESRVSEKVSELEKQGSCSGSFSRYLSEYGIENLDDWEAVVDALGMEFFSLSISKGSSCNELPEKGEQVEREDKDLNKLREREAKEREDKDLNELPEREERVEREDKDMNELQEKDLNELSEREDRAEREDKELNELSEREDKELNELSEREEKVEREEKYLNELSESEEKVEREHKDLNTFQEIKIEVKSLDVAHELEKELKDFNVVQELEREVKDLNVAQETNDSQEQEKPSNGVTQDAAEKETKEPSNFEVEKLAQDAVEREKGERSHLHKRDNEKPSNEVARDIAERERRERGDFRWVRRAWQPHRPAALPSLSRQWGLSGRFCRRGAMNMGNGRLSERICGRDAMNAGRPLNAPVNCPICYEDLDDTDLSFSPCPCGFHLCLFCHKRILEDDGRCPGCRKQYDLYPYEHRF